MFAHCNSLQNIDALKTWNVSNGEDFSYMFSNCESLQNIDALKTWNVENGKDFSQMFSHCESLQTIDELQTWNVGNATYFLYMFEYCTSLQNILLPNTLSILRKDIFYKCNPTLKIHWKNHIYTYEDLLEYQTIY